MHTNRWFENRVKTIFKNKNTDCGENTDCGAICCNISQDGKNYGDTCYHSDWHDMYII